MQPSRISSLAAAVLALCLSSQLLTVGANAPGVATPLSAWRTGIASVYGVQGDLYAASFGESVGSCGYDAIALQSYPYWSVGALAPSNVFFMQGPVEACGQCFQVQCINDGATFAGKCNPNWQINSVTIMITDSCPECQSDQIDLASIAFNKIAPTANGRILTQYRRVTCTPQAGVTLRVDANRGSGGWMRLYVMNTAGTGAVQAVSVRSAGSSNAWSPLSNTFGADWETPSSPQQPLDMLVTADDGSQLTIPNAVVANYVGHGTAQVNFAQDPVPALAAKVAAAATAATIPVAPQSTSTAVSG